MEDDDKDDCVCPKEHCIMSDAKYDQTQWSLCSVDQVNMSFHRGMNSCLKNLPKKLFKSPTCGNGFVENGEDCGKKMDILRLRNSSDFFLYYFLIMI